MDHGGGTELKRVSHNVHVAKLAGGQCKHAFERHLKLDACQGHGHGAVVGSRQLFTEGRPCGEHHFFEAAGLQQAARKP